MDQELAMVRKIALVMVLGMMMGSAYAQGGAPPASVAISLDLPQRQVLAGEPLSATVTILNQSGQALKLPFDAGGDVLGPWSDVPALLVSAMGGKPHYCIQTARNMTADFPLQAEDGGYWAPPGKSIRFDLVFDLPKPEGAQPGSYSLVAHYEAQGRHLGQEGGIVGQPNDAYYVCNQCWKGTVDSAPVTITVQAPSGEDAAAYQAFKGDPLAHPSDLLQRFPTSTYAGYALIHTGPGGSLSTFEKCWTITARQRDDAWYVPQAASPARQEARRQLVRSNYQGFVQRAQAFLAIHPDFARADLLRKELANALFMLGQRDEALQEVQKLAKMSGPVAEEAKAVMANIKSAAPGS